MDYSEFDCDICLFKFKNLPLYGEFIKKKGICVHYYCLLSSNDIPQRGVEKSGIRGFLLNDIRESIPKFKNNECYICSGKNAAVRCAKTGCDRTWHYPCGRRNSCITQFIGKFNSYCIDHVPETNVMKHYGVFCHVCYQLLLSNHPARSIFSKCCLDSIDYCPRRTEEIVRTECFTHADCVQRYVSNAGYDASCINCPMETMTKEEWQDQMRMKGIFVPRQMATWESDKYFKEQTKTKCGNKDCKNPGVTKDVWTCHVCGCFPQHLKCAGVTSHDDYLCPKCYDQSFLNLVP